MTAMASIYNFSPQVYTRLEDAQAEVQVLRAKEKASQRQAAPPAATSFQPGAMAAAALRRFSLSGRILS